MGTISRGSQVPLDCHKSAILFVWKNDALRVKYFSHFMVTPVDASPFCLDKVSHIILIEHLIRQFSCNKLFGSH